MFEMGIFHPKIVHCVLFHPPIHRGDKIFHGSKNFQLKRCSLPELRTPDTVTTLKIGKNRRRLRRSFRLNKICLTY